MQEESITLARAGFQVEAAHQQFETRSNDVTNSNTTLSNQCNAVNQLPPPSFSQVGE